jgi:hypothetical protein
VKETTMTIENIELHDMDAWDALVEANRDAIIDRYGSVEKALQHARDGGLELGGGAAPLFIITFEF